MNLKKTVETLCKQQIQSLFGVKVNQLEIQNTKEEFKGHLTLVVFALLKHIKGNPAQIATQIGEALVENNPEIKDFNVIKGFLNLELNHTILLQQIKEIEKEENYGKLPTTHKNVMVEYSSPNTNKPIHLGHIRNNVLGFSVANIIEAAGNTVHKTQIVNDRGIHICKSMLAWKLFGNGETPETSTLKGDHLVGKYYVIFDKEYKKEIETLVQNGLTLDQAKKQAPLLIQAQEMLQKWEANDPEIIELWKQMNAWVYSGFDITYKRLGVNFDSIMYESNTYKLGKDIIEKGLDENILIKKEDGSVWIDLTQEGLDEKLLLRSNGTSVYMTQDIGTAVERFKQNDIQKLIYTVGNEQDYHFKVLFLTLKKLGYEWSDCLHHLSYGMVDLPDGKMKSREGTVIDADDILELMHQTAKTQTEELGKIDDFTEAERKDLFEKIGLAAIKYYILKVDPKKRILFNPKESIEFNGNTGPFIQYTYARIQSLIKKSGVTNFSYSDDLQLNKEEENMVLLLSDYPIIIAKAAEELSPALVANYVYEVAKTYNSFYQNNSVLQNENNESTHFRLSLSNQTAKVIQSAFALLGIEVVDRM